MTRWSRLNLLWPTLLVLLLVGSSLSVLNTAAPPSVLAEDTTDEAIGRAGGEIGIAAVFEPRASVGLGYALQTLQVDEEVNFRMAILNSGDTVQQELTVDVQVNVADENGNPIEGQVALQRSGDIAIDSVDSGTHVSAGDYVAGGSYVVQTSSATDLTWSPASAGLYSVLVTITPHDENDADPINNEDRFVVRVVDYYDVGVEAWWNLSEGLVDATINGADEATGGGVDFSIDVDVAGSRAGSQVRNLTIEICLTGGAADLSNSTIAGNPVATDGCADIEVGAGQTVTVFQNISGAWEDDPRNMNATRRVTDLGDSFEITGTMGVNLSASGGFTVTARVASMVTFDTHQKCAEPPWWDYGPDMQPGQASVDDDADGTVDESDEAGYAGTDDIKMFAEVFCEDEVQLDNIPSNDQDTVSGFSQAFHDIGIEVGIALFPENGGSSRVNVGDTLFFVTVVNFGSSPASNPKDWVVHWTISDPQGDPIHTNDSSDDCDSDAYEEATGMRYVHDVIPPSDGGVPFGFACLEYDISSARYQVEAAVVMLGDVMDENPANDRTSAYYEGINDLPVGLIEVRAATTPVRVGASIVLDGSRVTDTESSPEELDFTWSRQSPHVTEVLDGCNGMGLISCQIVVDHSWIGTSVIFARVEDRHGGVGVGQDGQLSFQAPITVYGEYSSVDPDDGDGFAATYKLVQNEPVPFSTNISQHAGFADVTLGTSASSYDSIVAFRFENPSGTVSINSILEETLMISYPSSVVGEDTFSIWYSTNEIAWADLGAGASTVTRDTTANTLTWTASPNSPNKLSGFFGIFAATSAPPAAGITSLTATPLMGGDIRLDWDVEGVVNWQEDLVSVNWSSDSLAAARGGDNSLAAINVNDTTTTFTATTHAMLYYFVVSIENTNGYNSTYGEATATADSMVQPAPTVTAFTVTEGTANLTFSWTTSDDGDIAMWRVCQSGQQITTSLFASQQVCWDTADAATKTRMIAKPTSQQTFHFALGGSDALGNMEGSYLDTVASQKATIDLTDPSSPGVDPLNNEDDIGTGDFPMLAWAAIGGVVLLAIIIGAIILVRGGGDDGGGKGGKGGKGGSDWDY